MGRPPGTPRRARYASGQVTVTRAGLLSLSPVASWRVCLTGAVESNRVTESTTTSLQEHHPVHIKEVGR